MDTTLLELNKEYKYNELCEILKEPFKKGGSRVYQKEDWKRYFDWTNPTTQIYLITKIYDVPKEKTRTRGGKRKGAGNKPKVVDEFNYIFNCFLYDNIERKNLYYRRSKEVNEFHFSNDAISTYFGCCNNINYGIIDNSVIKDSYQAIARKVREKRDSWIYNKIKKVEGITLTYGTLAFKTRKSIPVYRDDLVEQYFEYRQEFITENKFGSIEGIIETKRWDEMIAYVTNKIGENNDKNKYEIIKLCRKIIVDTDIVKIEKYDTEKREQYKKSLNDKIIKEIYKFFLEKEEKKFAATAEQRVTEALMQLPNDTSYHDWFNKKIIMAPYKYVIDNYVRI